MAKKIKEGEDLVASALTIVKESLTVFTEAAGDEDGGIIVSLDSEPKALGRFVEVSHPFPINDYDALKVSEFKDGFVVANHFVQNDPANAEQLATVIMQFLGVETAIAEAQTLEGDGIEKVGTEVKVGEVGTVSNLTDAEQDAEVNGLATAMGIADDVYAEWLANEEAETARLVAENPDSDPEYFSVVRRVERRIADDAEKAQQEILEKAHREGKL